MKKIKLNTFEIHKGENIKCSKCGCNIATKNERIYRTGYWKEYDVIYCNIACFKKI